MKSVVDFHTHILPGIDDGSRSVEESIAMLHREAEQGVQHVVATPHFYANHESPHNFLARRQEAEETLRAAMEEFPDMPRVSVGAEVYFFEGMSDTESLPDMAIAGTDCILVEMPMKQWSDRNLYELEDIYRKRRLTPIIAHVDRYMTHLRSRSIPERLAQLPVFVQANATFFTGRRTQRLALNLLQRGRIHLIGSDCHNLETRPPNLDSAVWVIESALGTDIFERIHSLEEDILGNG